MSITVCSEDQHPTNGVTSETFTARKCANTSVYGCNYVQWFTHLPVFVICDLCTNTVLNE